MLSLKISIMETLTDLDGFIIRTLLFDDFSFFQTNTHWKFIKHSEPSEVLFYKIEVRKNEIEFFIDISSSIYKFSNYNEFVKIYNSIVNEISLRLYKMCNQNLPPIK